jgi:amidohydrolase
VPGRVRLLFQPAEEVAEGALAAMGEGAITGVDRIFALHCDPRFEVGQLGLRTGPITGACDKIKVRVSGPGGHTARPHLTADLVYALGKIVTELPAALSRRVDPRSTLSLVWGRISAGQALNAIPEEGFAAGTVRCLDEEAWHQAPDLLKGLVSSVASAYGVIAELDYVRGVPPAVNDGESVAMLGEAAALVLGPDGAAQAPQSLGGEDVAWYLESVPGALARLGTSGPQTPTDLDIHQPNFDVDERAIAVGVKVMAATALIALSNGSLPEPVVASAAGSA